MFKELTIHTPSVLCYCLVDNVRWAACAEKANAKEIGTVSILQILIQLIEVFTSISAFVDILLGLLELLGITL